jgi:riboflavin kinase/FMN adenylyltransferase
MTTYWSLDEIPQEFGPSAITIGKFDGVHIGHVEIIRQLEIIAESRGLTATVVTFDKHPAALFNPSAKPVEITGMDRRLELIERAGVHTNLVLPFTQELAALSPREFVAAVLVRALRSQVVLVGHDFRFGAHAEGDVDQLRSLGVEFGFEVVLIDDVSAVNGMRVSSSQIRVLMGEGDVETAGALLGRMPAVRGEVVHGAKRGRELGYPTANLSQESTGLIPADGVYAGWFTDAGVRYPTAISVGSNPTFEGVHLRTVEAFLLDASLDLYGHDVVVEFAARLRGMVAFAGVEALIEQMDTDVQDVRKVLAL